MLFLNQWNQWLEIQNRETQSVKQNKLHINNITSRKLPMVSEFKMDTVEISPSPLIKAFVPCLDSFL